MLDSLKQHMAAGTERRSGSPGRPVFGSQPRMAVARTGGVGTGARDKALVPQQIVGGRTGQVGSSGSYLRVRLGESMAGAAAWPSSTYAGMAAPAGAIAASRSIALLETTRNSSF